MGLAVYDNYNRSGSFYEAIAWEGLIGTVAWNNKTESEKTTIRVAIADFKKTGDKQCL